jgi:hypothetical protein
MRSSRIRLVTVALVVTVLSSGCQYWAMAHQYEEGTAPVPWFCNPTAPNSVTGPGMGSVNWYAGTVRSPLSPSQCLDVSTGLDEAKAYAEQYPTLGDAEDAGFISSFAFIPGMGTHHGQGTLSPELLADPDFDRFNPVIPGSIVDDVFDPTTPEFLQYNGNSRDSVLVGISYYVRTTTGLPPAGYPGNNDWWHHHPTLCLSPTTAQAIGVNTTDSQCTSRGGINVYLDDYYMLHIWVVDDLEYHNDIHAPMHPCIVSTGAIFDMSDPCHGTGSGTGGFQSAALATEAEAADAPSAFCPIGQLAATES